MSSEKHIIASCVISNGIVEKNGTRLFEAHDGDVQAFLVNAYLHMGIDYPKFYKMDALSKLGWLASEILLKDEPSLKKYAPEEIAIVLGNANASLDVDFKYYKTVEEIASPALFVYTLPNIMIGEMSIRNGFKGENGFFIFDEFDAGFMETYVGGLMDSGTTKLCICGWVDVLGEDYHATLFLVENAGDDTILFNKANMDKIFSGKKI
ncbi:hypothetical protein QTN47_11435 [Danxiaibacter flavus]|uniref:3-oxoacyl-ACP synthase n=1 Tax=Danxiaibacter flavus TaxID=3049108 RepID=A0ABV3ZE09_9BACT|nr:hypothetical protein QNM32_11440 [Chitinophagaceae bacterium DXS]